MKCKHSKQTYKQPFFEMYRNKYNKRDFDATVNGLRHTVQFTRKPIKNKDNSVVINRQSAGGTNVWYTIYQDDTKTAASGNCQYCFKPGFEITKGTANGERIGNEIVMKTLYVNVDMYHESSDSNLNATAGPVRLLVFLDTQNNKTDGGSGDLFDTQSILSGPDGYEFPTSMRATDTRKRFIVLYDKTTFITKNLPNTSSEPLWHKQIKININKKCLWDDDDTNGRYNQILKNALYVYVISNKDENTGVNYQKHVRCATRLTYTD